MTLFSGPFCVHIDRLYIKRTVIRNRIYDTLEDLEEAVCDFINGLSEATIASVCNLSYLFS